MADETEVANVVDKADEAEKADNVDVERAIDEIIVGTLFRKAGSGCGLPDMITVLDSK